jgi:hypothetical protein
VIRYRDSLLYLYDGVSWEKRDLKERLISDYWKHKARQDRKIMTDLIKRIAAKRPDIARDILVKAGGGVPVSRVTPDKYEAVITLCHAAFAEAKARAAAKAAEVQS